MCQASKIVPLKRGFQVKNKKIFFLGSIFEILGIPCLYILLLVGLFVRGIVFLFGMKEELLLSIKIKEVIDY